MADSEVTPPSKKLISSRLLTSPPTLEGIAAWIAKPDPKVGLVNSPLTAAPAGLDTASLSGSKTQNFTSWASYSRSYVASYTLHSAAAPPPSLPLLTPRPTTSPDIPTTDELSRLSKHDRQLLQAGKRLFFRPYGLLTPHQLTDRRVLETIQSYRDVIQRPASAPSKDDPPIDPPNLSTPTTASSDAQSAPTAFSSDAQSTSSGDSAYTDLVDPSAQSPRPSPSLIFSDSLPVRSFSVSHYPSDREIGEPIPYTPTYTTFQQRLNDPASSGALGQTLRSPSARDATSIAALTKYLSRGASSLREIAPLVRLASIATSLSSPNYSSEIIHYRFTRDFVPDPTTFKIEIAPPPPNANIRSVAIAMPLDIFTAWTTQKTQDPFPPTHSASSVFTPSNIDAAWTAVPIRSETYSSPWLTAYTASFLSSEFWNGRVNWSISGNSVSNDKSKQVPTTAHYMPSTSSVYIPGPTNIVYVLIDSTSSGVPPAITLPGSTSRIPVFFGTTFGGNVNPVNFVPVFDQWFTTDNAPSIPTLCNEAFYEVNKSLAIENTADLALSVVAETYATLYPGLGIAPHPDSPSYDFATPAHGAWKITQEETIDANSRVLCSHLAYLSYPETTRSRRRMVGYNFSALSSLHRPPSACTLTRPSPTDLRVWAGRRPDYNTPTNNVTTMDSIARVAVACNLISTTEHVLRFSNGAALAGWVHMLSGALAAQTAMFLAQNNFCLRSWTGYDTFSDRIYGRDAVCSALDACSAGMFKPYYMSDTAHGWPEWDVDQISDYFCLDPFTDHQWLSHSPLPAVFTLQWIKKMRHSWGNRPKPFHFNHRNVTHLAIKLTETSGEYRLLSTTTIDFDRYAPLVLFQPESLALTHTMTWVDSYSHFTIAASTQYVAPPKSYLSSSTFILPPVSTGIELTADLNLYVLNSNILLPEDAARDIRVSSILYPDPVDLRSILAAAKNYLLYPALSGLAGFLTGGPAGGLIAAGSHLASNLISNLPDSKSKAAAQSVVNAATEHANKAFNVPPPSGISQLIQNLNPGKNQSQPTVTSTSPSQPNNPTVSTPPDTFHSPQTHLGEKMAPELE